MTARNHMIIAVVAAAAAMAAYWFLVLTPKQEEAAKLQTQIAAKQTELETAKREIASHEQAKASYRSNYAAVARLGKAVPADDDVRSLMVQIGSAAADDRVAFNKINAAAGSSGAGVAGDPAAAAALPPGVTLNAAGFGEQSLSFSFAGTFFQLSDFVRRLDRFVTVDGERVDVTGRLLQLSSIKLAPDAAKGFPAINAEISAKSFVINPSDDAASGATPQGPAAAGAGTTPPASSATTPPTTTAAVTGAVR
jgi:hypothetical protein